MRLAFAIKSSYVVAILLVAISLAGLFVPDLYRRETAAWLVQARAQDWFDLVVAAPLLVIAARLAGSSERGRSLLAGVLLFAVYTLAIYAFAIHLNAAFLIYCAALGLAVYALIALPVVPLPASRGRRWPAGFLVGVGIAFALLWLAQLVPSAITGEPPAEIAATGLATNPVHVLDLAFILPLHVLAGVALWRGLPLGRRLAPVVLVFGAVMSTSIACLMIFERSPMAVVMGAIAVVSVGMARRVMMVP